VSVTAAAPEPDGPVHVLPEGAGVYEFAGTTPKTYLFPGFPPQSAVRGDVCALPYDPGDGQWQPTKKKVTRLDDPAVEAERRRAELAALQPQDAPPPRDEQAAAAAGKA